MNNELLLLLGAVLGRLTILLLLAIVLIGFLRRAEPRWRVLVLRAVYVALPLALVASALAPQLVLPLLPAERAQAAAPIADSIVRNTELAAPNSTAASLAAEGVKDTLLRTALFVLVPWMTIALLLALREILRLRHFTSKRVLADTERAGRSLTIAWNRTCGEFGIPAPVLRLAAEQTSPYLSSGFSNALVVPRSLTSPGQLDRLGHVFRHEAAHLANRDRGWILFARFLTCALWFHPLAWWMESLHLRACEEACDAEAARRGDADAYAGALAALALDLVPQKHPVTAFLRLPSVRDRIRSLRGHARQTPPSRSKCLPLLAAIVGIGVATGNLGIARKDSPATGASQSDTEERLRSIVVPSIKFRDTPLPQAIEYLQRRSAELDSLGRGVNMILSQGARAKSDTEITLTLTNVPLVEALRYTTSLASMSFRADGAAVIIETSDESAAAAKAGSPGIVKNDVTLKPVVEKLNTIVVPLIDVREAPLTDVINFLRQKSIELDTATTDREMKGLNMIVMEGPRARVPITLKISDVPLMDALRYVTELSGTTLEIRPIGVVIKTEEPPSPGSEPGSESPAPELLYTKVYSIAKRIYERALANSGKTSAKDLLAAAGVSFPPGAAAIYNPATGQLVIRNTEKELGRVEAWLDGLGKNK